MTSFRRVLIANRGEIAVRLACACRETGLESVAVYSEADADAPHTRCTDFAVCIGPPPSRESYLNIDRLIAAARSAGADAVHPGYGFLAESAPFARAVQAAGLTFIGPDPDAIATMGDKTLARRTVAASGVPVAPADEDPPAESEPLRAAARRVGYPLLIKAAAGGGGKGMRVVRGDDDLATAFAAAAREAQGAFGDARLFLERYIERPRHVEVQILADAYGGVVALGERECSIQRRHQKVLEESPSPALSAALRERMVAAALQVARCVNYRNAGTVEFLLAPNGEFYFLEMNTRLQVEHPITELVTGIDLVQAQFRLAAGERLWLRQDDIVARGHAIECRIYAEDPGRQFLPQPGTILSVREPRGPGVRVDSGIAQGFTVPVHYDPLLAKVSVWNDRRETARQRMRAALGDYLLLGCTTNISFLIDLLAHPAFVRGETHTDFIADYFPQWSGQQQHRLIASIAAAIDVCRMTSRAPAGLPSEIPSPWMTLGGWRLGRP